MHISKNFYRLIKEAENSILAHSMLEKGDRVLLGLSGGPDSIALFKVLSHLSGKMGFALLAAHVNYGLRGEDSDLDEALALQTAAGAGIPFFLKKAAIRGDSFSREGESLQALARKIRFDFFAATAQKEGITKVALAHNKNDQAETIIYNFLRGSGPRGLRGMTPVSKVGPLTLIRPFLGVTRSGIMAYLDGEGVFYRIDRTNGENKYFRNRIRNRLLPFIKKEFGLDVSGSLSGMGEVLGEENNYLEEMVKAIYNNLNIRDVLDWVALEPYPEALRRRIIYEFLCLRCPDVYLTAGKILSISGCMRKGRGTSLIDLKEAVRARISYGRLSIEKPAAAKKGFSYSFTPEATHCIKEAGVEISAEVAEKGAFDGSSYKDPGESFLDYGRLRGRALVLRSRKPGDRFSPYGIKGVKKLKEFFIDCKVPAGTRDDVPLLCDGDRVICIPGARTDNDFIVTENTAEILKLTVKGNKYYEFFHK